MVLSLIVSFFSLLSTHQYALARYDVIFLIYGPPTLLTGPHFLSIREQRMADPGGLATLPANHHQIGEAHGGLLLHYAPLDIFLRIGASVPTQHIDAFHHSPVTSRGKAQDLTPLSTVFPRQNQHLIIFFDV